MSDDGSTTIRISNEVLKRIDDVIANAMARASASGLPAKRRAFSRSDVIAAALDSYEVARREEMPEPVTAPPKKPRPRK